MDQDCHCPGRLNLVCCERRKTDELLDTLILEKTMIAAMHSALVRRTPDCGPLRLGRGQMTSFGLDPRWLLVEVHQLHRRALEREGAQERTGANDLAVDGETRIVRFVIDGRLDRFHGDSVAIFERMTLPSAATLWSSVTRFVAERGAEARVELVSQAALTCGHSLDASDVMASEFGEPRCHMHRVLGALDLDEAGRPAEAVLVDAFARAESIMLADATGVTRRREIDIRGRASCGDTIDVSTRIRRLDNAGQNNWKLVGTARRRSDGHLLATCETCLDALT